MGDSDASRNRSQPPPSVDCLSDRNVPGSRVLRLRLYPSPLDWRRAAVVSAVYIIPMSLFQLRHGGWSDVATMFAVLSPVLFALNLWGSRRVVLELHLSDIEVSVAGVHYRLRDGWWFRAEPQGRASWARWKVLIGPPGTNAPTSTWRHLLRDQAEYLARELTDSVARARAAA